MPSSYTTNKSIEQPVSGSYNNAWAAPVNADWEDIDNAFGGLTSISVTGISGNIVLTLSQYQPPNIVLTGALTANINYYLPAGVGGLWSILNSTSGAFTITFLCDTGGGRSVPLAPAARSFVVSDGTNVDLAQTIALSFANISGTIAASQVPQIAVGQYQATLDIDFPQMIGAASVAQIPSLPASKISSGTLSNTVLPNPGVGPGVTIAADPGGTPSGAPGSIWYYY